MNQNRVLFFVLLLILIVSSSLGAEETATTSKENNLLFFLEIGNKSGFNQEQTILFYESLFSRLTKMSKGLTVLEAPTDKPVLTIAEKTELAQKLNAQTWVLVKIQGQLKPKVQNLTLQVFNLATAKLVIDKIIRKDEELTARAIERNYWNDIYALLKAYYLPDAPKKDNTTATTSQTANNTEQTAQKRATNIEDGANGELIIKATPGSKIYGLAKHPLVVGADSLVVANVTVPGTYVLECEAVDFYTVKKEIYIDQRRTLLTLEQQPGARYALDLYTINASFFGADFVYYLKPNTAYVKAGINSYMFGIFLNNEEFNPSTGASETVLLQSYPLTHFYLSIGYYFNREDSLFRFYSSFSLFTRIFYSAGNGVALEPISPFGAQPALGMEISSLAKFRFFMEYAPLFCLTSRPDLLLASYTKSAGNNQGPFIPLPFMVIGLVNFQLGVRWIF